MGRRLNKRINKNNRITELFGIQYPIISGGMVWCSSWRLASAVSNAGGLGLLGAGKAAPIYADNTVYFEEAKLVLVCKKVYASELQESGFLYHSTIDESYPQRDFHTMYVGKIEKVLVKDDEYLK